MCGLCGYFGNAAVDAPPDRLINSMLNMIAHRGPDGRDLKIFDGAGLGHVRLAIIDIDGGRQPMATTDERYWMSYNGELYNYREIRKTLQNRGVKFKTNSDTEVVLNAFALDGIQAVKVFRGMFSLAVWDNHDKEGFLIRDRYGIKPLYYGLQNNRFFFASEIKAIVGALNTTPDLDLKSLHMLMNFRYIPGEKTFFRDINHLPPGHFLHWTTVGFSIKKWAIEPPPTPKNIPADSCRELLETAVRRQLVCDVPLGSYLSAGIDSATILALSLKGAATPPIAFPTFTIRTGDSPLEGHQAATTARIFGVSNIQEEFDDDLEGNLHRMIWHLEVPKVNAYQSAMVARLASKNVKVALSGLGGDEIFLGYNIHKFLHNLTTLRQYLPDFLFKVAGKTIHKTFSHPGLRTEEFSRGGQVLESLPDFSRAYGILRNVWDSPTERTRIYGERMLSQDLPDMFDFLKSKWPEGDDQVKNCADFELEHKMVNDLLLQEDRLSMAFGLEVRVPFLDEDLAGALSALPSSTRIPGGKLKKLMKDTVSAWVPKTVLNRPKSGFQIPVHLLFESHLKPLAHKYLPRERLEKEGLFNPRFVNNIMRAKPSPRLRWHYFLLYLMIGTNIWIDVFQNNSQTPQWSKKN
ncbi:MAG: asparagine synthase (glutamine-hydrolyzing) [Proteobacteria bacterium]|nr:asparagine synthase (glutamine-hydrolyzing) [Pseudomonadota bacterium]MBU1739229.1 asparagine synthase (glutamine-hydrolyzing) [Pseudomonadota bacterium]